MNQDSLMFNQNGECRILLLNKEILEKEADYYLNLKTLDILKFLTSVGNEFNLDIYILKINKVFILSTRCI